MRVNFQTYEPHIQRHQDATGVKVDDVGLERLHYAANLEPLAQVVSALAGEFLIAADIDGIPFDPVRQTPGQAIHMVGDSSRPPISYIKNFQTIKSCPEFFRKTTFQRSTMNTTLSREIRKAKAECDCPFRPLCYLIRHNSRRCP